MEKGKSFRLFGTFSGSPGAIKSFLKHFLEPLGHLWETFGDPGGPKASKSVPKATQRPQGSPKRLRKDDMARLSP